MSVNLLWSPNLEKPMSERLLLERKKGFIRWPKNGEEGALLTNKLLNSRRVEELQV
jgi:hypothetical protein